MNKKKKKILILCVDFPPWPSIGAQRPASWCRYVDPDEFEITVITRKWVSRMIDTVDYFINPVAFPDETYFGYAKVFYTNFRPNLRDKIILKRKNRFILRLIQKILTAFYYIAPYYFRIFDSTREIFFKAVQYLKNNPDVMMIVATGEPFITFRYAYLLSKKFRVPWCADYRDGWSTNYGLPYMSFVQRFVLKQLLGKMEKFMVKSARLVITVTPALKSALQKHLNRSVEVVFNGYDPVEIHEVVHEAPALSEKFTLTYLGSLYPFQPLEEFASFIFKLIKDSILDISKISIKFIGGKIYENRIREAFKIIPELDLVITPKVERSLALKSAYSSHVLLLFASGSIDGSAAKIYDYLALRRPIFVYKNDNGTIKFLLDYTKTGLLHTDYDSSRLFFHELYNAYILGNTFKFETKPFNIEEFSREYQTKKFFQLINSHGRG